MIPVISKEGRETTTISNKDLSPLRVKGILYDTAIIHDRETWALDAENWRRLEWHEVLIKWYQNYVLHKFLPVRYLKVFPLWSIFQSS